jgi:hypothetical protein
VGVSLHGSYEPSFISDIFNVILNEYELGLFLALFVSIVVWYMIVHVMMNVTHVMMYVYLFGVCILLYVRYVNRY